MGTLFFALAVMHSFLVGVFEKFSHQFSDRPFLKKMFHALGEIELVFGFWALIWILFSFFSSGIQAPTRFLLSLSFAEPIFVMVVMLIAGTDPILVLAQRLIDLMVSKLPMSKGLAKYVVTLIVGPLLGSLITEPAAMTLTASLLLRDGFHQSWSARLRYFTLGVLFVNISVGGVLTHYSAPPVIMVAAKWGWNTPYLFSHFGWKAILAVVINSLIGAFFFRRELSAKSALPEPKVLRTTSGIQSFLSVMFLVATVLCAHHLWACLGILFVFYCFVQTLGRSQTPIVWSRGVKVALFLGGLVILGPLQTWWVEPLLRSLSAVPLFFGSVALTAVLDNAALTYLGAQVPDLTQPMRYALLSGAVTGGGLTVIANAPNPAGYAILKDAFGAEGIQPLPLLKASLLPTLVSAACFGLGELIAVL